MVRLLTAAFAVAATPSLAPALPVPKNVAPTPRYATVQSLFGKAHVGKEVRAVCRQLGEHPVIVYARLVGRGFWDPARDDGKDDDMFFLDWKAKGFALTVTHGKVVAVRLYGKDDDGYGRYPGELPGGLHFADDPAAVERKLGKPEDSAEMKGVREVGGRPQDEFWCLYKTKGYWITFRRLRGDPYQIRSIDITEPTKN